jgi:hypothetical protein
MDSLSESLYEFGPFHRVRNNCFDWEWETSEKNFRKAVELKESYPAAHHWYGDSSRAEG